ncbi:MAG: hypothetical protein JNL11_02160 [Bdellovibrionaceae bacterium]|nr:hypothetical protein [Pseudobdellovibrionaceae bacterium]
MKNKFVVFIFIAPFLLWLLLWSIDFEIDTSVFLSMSLQVVWAVLFALGGGVIYLSKFKFTQSSEEKFYKLGTDNIKSLCFPLIFQTLLFMIVSLLYPSRNFIKKLFSITPEISLKISIFSDSFLMSLITISSLGSLIVGAWCLYLAIYRVD